MVGRIPDGPRGISPADLAKIIGGNAANLAGQAPVPTYTGATGGSRGTAPKQQTAAQRAQAAAQSAAQQAAAEAAAAQARATQAANSNARSQANQNILQLNQQITAKTAQRDTNLQSLEALKKLVSGGLQGVRDTQLKAVQQSLDTKMKQIQTTFDTSMGDFNQNLRDNEATESDASFANLANRSRERGDLLTQALSQGAGESDMLMSQLQALRNWSANQGDVNRSFFDTQSSINAGITDLNNATKTSRINEETSANSSRADIWDQFYGSTADTYTQMANIDQQNYLLEGEIKTAEDAKLSSNNLLNWLDGGNNFDTYVEPALASRDAPRLAPYTSTYAADAAKAASSTWTNPGVSKETLDWTGGATSDATLNSSSATNAPANVATKKRPEGAGLRKW